MARKRYDGLKTTLGGGLTSSGTTITFAAALTYHGAQADAVPTLGGSDYIPLGILDANGVVCEVVWLTAYTAGATTGTIVRGKEGSTGIAHTTGDKVVCAGTARDMAFAGERYDNPDDSAWGPDLGFDLEFEDDTTSLPSGWAWVNQGTSTYEQKYGKGLIVPQAVTGADRFAMITRSLSGFPSTWDAIVKAETPARVPSNWYRYGICLRESSSGKFTAVGATVSGSWNAGYNISVNDWTNPTTFSGGEVFVAAPQTTKYYRIRKGASTYDLHASTNGIDWAPITTGKSAFATYDQIGLYVHAPVALTYAFDWFRVR